MVVAAINARLVMRNSLVQRTSGEGLLEADSPVPYPQFIPRQELRDR